MKTLLKSIFFSLLLLLLLASLANLAKSNGMEGKKSIPPCEYEDQDNCYWLADKHGNGTGTSFVVIDGAVFTLEK